MTLELESRICGNVHVVECRGRIVGGQEVKALEGVLKQDIGSDLYQVVLQVAGVTRLDSMGLGLIVRYAAMLGQHGGGLRLAAPPKAITEVLETMHVSGIVVSYPTEQEAVDSFAARSGGTDGRQGLAGRVLVVDSSADFCAFVRAVLMPLGYEVRTASLVRDAKILIQVSPVDTILVGPNLHAGVAETTAFLMQEAAPKSQVLLLNPELKAREARDAAEFLLHLIGAKAA